MKLEIEVRHSDYGEDEGGYRVLRLDEKWVGRVSDSQMGEVLVREFTRLQEENDTLRRLVANSDLPCIYCQLPKVDMAKCKSGFPGCARADDMTL